MQFLVQMLILLSCFLAICYPELVFSTMTTKTLRKIINLHRSNESVSNAHTRIIGAQKDNFMNRWPWYAALVNTKSARHIFCGGSLITPRWILTAAHCVCQEGTDTFKVWMGVHWAPQAHIITNPNNKWPKRISEGEEFSVKRVILHEKYDPVKSTHDIALIELDDPNNRIPKVSETIDLPMIHEVRDRQECIVTGFGVVDEKGNQPDKLQFTNVQVVPQKECREQYQKQYDECKMQYPKQYKYKCKNYADFIDDSMLCAGYYRGRHDACQGDSGGPLACRNNVSSKKKYHLRGVVSWGDGCGEAKKFGVYANVFQFLDWIKQKLKTYN